MAMKLESCTPAEEIRSALKALDTSKYETRGIDKPALTGMSYSEDFQTMMSGLGMSQKEITEVLLWAKPNKDGMLDYKEFTRKLMENEDPEFFLMGIRNDVSKKKAVMRRIQKREQQDLALDLELENPEREDEGF